MSIKTRNLFLIGILIIAIFLRFYHLTSTPPGLYPDEAMDGNNAVQAAETNHFQVFYTEDNGREGLYVNIIALFLKVWPIYEPWVIRLPAAIAGVLTVWGIYLLVAELFGDGPGLLAAFLLATSFWHINFSRIGFRAILAPLLLTWALYFFIRALKTASKRNAWFWGVGAGIVYGLGFYTYIAYRITPLLFLLFIPFYKKKKEFWKRTLIFFIITFIVAAPIGLYFIKHPADFFGRTSEISVTNSGNPLGDFATNIWKTALMFNVHGDDNWRHNVSGTPELFFPVGILFVVGIVLGLYAVIQTWRKKKIPGDIKSHFPLFGTLIAFGWFLSGALPEAASNEGIPHSLRSILMLPAAIIFAAIAGVWTYDRMKRYWHKKAANTVAVIFLVLVAVFAYVDYFIAWDMNPNVPGAFNADYVEIGREINALPTSTPKYVIVTAGGVLADGVPVPAETTMFITHSFTAEDQTLENIHYLLPDQTSTIPVGTPNADIFVIQ